jgi:hypothetical protein
MLPSVYGNVVVFGLPSPLTRSQIGKWNWGCWMAALEIIGLGEKFLCFRDPLTEF